MYSLSTSRKPRLSCSRPVRRRVAFLEALLQRAERKLAGPGRPGRSTAWWPVERWEALRLALGARGCLAARGGFTTRLQGCLVSILAPPTAPSPRAVREGLAKLGRIAPRERGRVAG